MSTLDPSPNLRAGYRAAAVLLATACAGIGGAHVATALTPRTYQAHASVLITGDAGQLMPTIARLAETREVALATANEARVPAALAIDHISADSQPGMQILTLTATAHKPTDAANIANAATRVLSLEMAKQPLGVAGRIAAHTLDEAAVPSEAATPLPLLNDAIGALLGLMAGLGLMSMRRRLDDRLRWPDQIEAQLGLPILAAIPGISRRSIRSGARSAYRRRRVAEAAGEAAALLTALTHSTDHRRLLVTEVRADDRCMGAALLALGLAECHEHVTLIDAQLSRSAMARQFPESEEFSLQSVLTGPSPVMPERLAAPSTLTVMPAAPADPRTGAALLRGRPFAELVDKAAQTSDLVLVHAPAVLQGADIAAPALRTDAAVLVVRAGMTRCAEMRRAVLLLQRIGTPIEGVLVLGAIGTRRSTFERPGGATGTAMTGLSRTAPQSRRNSAPDFTIPSAA
ncbi:hypothetical protein KGA66_03185 [Actinocrinis puniceicyclus]|uniref:Capsular polysaccharide biosynthesis protein n=1 Tax=Actinocrinis puniceicyclus TaxID=977794 RepID=A0A8J7WKZ6_9ACTN|nr:hypothetical protein [Actinocrinis puniceicyclus]MBS2962037.1 hypothetical protein [Actinocrinis puniceicyclus]